MVVPLPVDPLAQPKRDQARVAALEPPTALQSEEASSSSKAMPAPFAQPVERPRVLNDGPKVDAWLGQMEKRGAIDEIETFFYDSLSDMMGRVEEFIGL